jgi:GGDEF domain-containing protein
LISIASFLKGGGVQEAYGILLRVTTLLLEGIAVNAVGSSGPERSLFQTAIRRFAAEIASENHKDAQDLLVIVGSAIQCLQEYHANVDRRWDAQTREYQSMLVLLTTAISKLLHGNERAVRNLETIDKQLQHASQLEDLRGIRTRIEICLDSVRAEVADQVDRSRLVRGTFKTASAAPVVRYAMELTGTDPSTGLPGRRAACEALAAAVAAGDSKFAAAIVIERLGAIANRFGAGTADEVLLMVCQMLAQRMAPGDQLFRWSGPGFLALLHREMDLEAVRAEVARWSNPRPEFTIEVNDRTILLTPSYSALVLAAWQTPETESLVAQIDSFIPSSPDPASSRTP